MHSPRYHSFDQAVHIFPPYQQSRIKSNESSWSNMPLWPTWLDLTGEKLSTWWKQSSLQSHFSTALLFSRSRLACHTRLNAGFFAMQRHIQCVQIAEYMCRTSTQSEWCVLHMLVPEIQLRILPWEAWHFSLQQKICVISSCSLPWLYGVYLKLFKLYIFGHIRVQQSL